MYLKFNSEILYHYFFAGLTAVEVISLIFIAFCTSHIGHSILIYMAILCFTCVYITVMIMVDFVQEISHY